MCDIESSNDPFTVKACPIARTVGILIETDEGHYHSFMPHKYARKLGLDLILAADYIEATIETDGITTEEAIEGLLRWHERENNNEKTTDA